MLTRWTKIIFLCSCQDIFSPLKNACSFGSNGLCRSWAACSLKMCSRKIKLHLPWQALDTSEINVVMSRFTWKIPICWFYKSYTKYVHGCLGIGVAQDEISNNLKLGLTCMCAILLRFKCNCLYSSDSLGFHCHLMHSFSLLVPLIIFLKSRNS